MLLTKLRFDPAFPIIARLAGRAVAGSINFSCSSLIQQHLKAQRFGVAVVEGSGIDGANEALALDAERVEAQRVREEQGHVVQLPPLEIAAKLKVIRNAIAEDLEQHAGRKQSVMRPGETFPDQFHVAATFEDSIAYQMRLMPRVNDADIRAEAKALNISEDEVRAAYLAQNQKQLNYLRENSADVIKCFNELVAYGSDGHPLTTMQDEMVFDSLPAIYKLRIAAAADRGLYNGRANEIIRHRGGNLEAKGNLAQIDGVRREIFAEVARWVEAPQFKMEIEDAQKRGSPMPQFSPAPHEQKPDERDEALARHDRKAA